MDKPKKEKTLCSGCYNNDYNFGLGSAKECWNFKGAEVIKRIAVGVDECPPYDTSKGSRHEPRYMMSCFNKKRMVYVSPDSIRSDGYWKC